MEETRVSEGVAIDDPVGGLRQMGQKEAMKEKEARYLILEAMEMEAKLTAQEIH